MAWNPIQKARDLYRNVVQYKIPQTLGRIASNPTLNRVATNFQNTAQPAVSKLQQPIQASIGQAMQRFPDTTLNMNIPQPKPIGIGNFSPINLTKFATSLPGEFVRSYGRTMERAWNPQRAIQQYKAHPITTGIEDIGNVSDISPLLAGVPILAGMAKSKFDAAQMRKLLPEIRAVKRMFETSSQFDINQFSAIENLVKKIYPQIKKPLNQVIKNPDEYERFVYGLLKDAEYSALNPELKLGLGTRALKSAPEQATKIKKYLKRAYQVYSGQKSDQIVANLAEDVAKNTELPRDIVVKKAFFDHMSTNHPEINKQELFNFVKTVNIPDEIYKISKENRLNFFRELENQTINLVSTGKDWTKPQQNVITSLKAVDQKEMNYLNKIKKTSEKVFPINPGGAVKSSSDMLSQVPGVGDRLPRSSESIQSIAQDVNLNKDLEDFLNGKISDTIIQKPIYKRPAQAGKGGEVSIPQVHKEEVVRTGRKLSQGAGLTTEQASLGTKSQLGRKELQILGSGGQPSTLEGPSLKTIIPDLETKFREALSGAGLKRETQEAIYKVQRARKFARFEEAGKTASGESGAYRQLGQLGGQMKHVEFDTLRKSLNQGMIDALFDKGKQLPSVGDKATYINGLRKLLSGEGGIVPTKSELEVMSQVLEPATIEAILAKRTSLQKLFSMAEGGLNLPRAVMATADLSAPLRQGVFMIGRPKQFIPAFKDMFRYAFSEKAYQGLLGDIKTRPSYGLMREGKLAITDMSPILSQREEMFMSNLVEKIPGFGKIARGSNRAYSGFLNKLRADVFDDLVGKAKLQGKEISGKSLDDLAGFINAATGRGNLPKSIEKVAPLLNGVFFSPRLMASRLQLLNPVTYIKYDPFVRKEALKTLFNTSGILASVLALASLGGAEVGNNPRSADFGKIKVGNTRYDILGGFQQYIRLSSQLLTGKVISSTTGKEITLGEGYKPLTRKDILMRFFEAKESPVASFITALMTGQTGVGEPVNIPTEVINRFIPMMLQDVYDIAKDKDSVGQGLLMALPGVFGVGSQTYGKSELIKGKTPIGQESMQIRPVQGLAETISEKVFGQKPVGSSANFNVESYYQQLKAMPPEQANSIVKEIKSTNKDLYDKLLQVKKDEKAGVTVQDKTLMSKGVASGDRAMAIAKELNNLKTPEEKNALVKRYIKLGIITDDVKKQLILLKKQGKL